MIFSALIGCGGSDYFDAAKKFDAEITLVAHRAEFQAHFPPGT